MWSRPCARPGCGDTCSAIPVAGHGDLLASEELDSVVADLPGWQVATHQGAHPQFRVSLLQPAHDSPEGEVIDVAAEEVFHDTVLEVCAPPGQHRVESAQQVSECSMGCPMGQCPHLVLDGSYRLSRRIGVYTAVFPP